MQNCMFTAEIPVLFWLLQEQCVTLLENRLLSTLSSLGSKLIHLLTTCCFSQRPKKCWWKKSSAKNKYLFSTLCEVVIFFHSRPLISLNSYFFPLNIFPHIFSQLIGEKTCCGKTKDQPGTLEFQALRSANWAISFWANSFVGKTQNKFEEGIFCNIKLHHTWVWFPARGPSFAAFGKNTFLWVFSHSSHFIQAKKIPWESIFCPVG